MTIAPAEKKTGGSLKRENNARRTIVAFYTRQRERQRNKTLQYIDSVWDEVSCCMLHQKRRRLYSRGVHPFADQKELEKKLLI
jgi:hypothetical protein